jgi:hypothetical protein
MKTIENIIAWYLFNTLGLEASLAAAEWVVADGKTFNAASWDIIAK